MVRFNPRYLINSYAAVALLASPVLVQGQEAKRQSFHLPAQDLRAPASFARAAGSRTSAQPLERLVEAEAATWIDRELVSGAPQPVRDSGFGHDVRAAQTRRLQWLVAQGFAEQTEEGTLLRKSMLLALERRELLRVAGQLSQELQLPFRETAQGDHLEGVYRRSVEGISGRFAVIERSRDFALVPWCPVLEKQLGKSVSGLMREDGISWSIGRGRSGPSIS